MAAKRRRWHGWQGYIDPARFVFLDETSAAFQAYVEQVLAPVLTPGDVVVLDNLAAHKVDGVAQTIRAAGTSILSLPPYSPDLNPIE